MVFYYHAAKPLSAVGSLFLQTCYQIRAGKGVSMRYRAFLIAAALLSACDRKAAAPASEAGTETVTAEVGAADAFGAPGEQVNDVAFWNHPGVAFESLVLTVNDAAVEAFAVETGELVFSVSGGADSIEVFYSEASSPGYLVAAGDGAYRLFAFAADGKSAAPLGLYDAAAENPRFCIAGGAEPVVYEIVDGTISSRALKIEQSEAELGLPIKLAETAGAIACHVDPLSDHVIVISSDGAIKRIDAGTGAVFGIALPADLSPESSSVAVGRTEEGDPIVQVALLDGKTGSISLFDGIDGHALGAVRVKATFDLDAVETASRVEIGSANFGGVYRDGALAVVTSGAGAPVRLVPWNGVMGALSLPVPAAPNPRRPKGEPAEEAVISIEVIEP